MKGVYGMTEITQFVQERNEALFSLDRQIIERYFRKRGLSCPKDDTLFWAIVYKCICEICSAPEDLTAKAREWLISHGMQPGIR